MTENNQFSYLVTVFRERTLPEEGFLAGYAAIINEYHLQLPLPDVMSIISHKHKQYSNPDWQVFTPRHRPEDTLISHLTFALKYEGINLYVLKMLFERLDVQEFAGIIEEEPTGQYRRRIWFLYEWLLQVRLNLPDMISGNYVDLVDSTLQYASRQHCENIKRQRIRNNLLGTKDFCPMIRRTDLLEEYIGLGLSKSIKDMTGKIHPDVRARAAAFLLLKDSKASYAIEGEIPTPNRALRWGRVIGQAGQIAISKHELIRLQQIVIDNHRFIKMGFRRQEGFIGEHDRYYGSPIPDHISARWKDVEVLIDGLIATNHLLEQEPDFDAVLAATIIAFGFVFIHPFVDGNGRIHRYLIHHALHRKGYVDKGLIFPVSSVMLERLDDYRRVLEAFSIPRLDYIDWKPDDDNNVIVLNESADLYRYFDATRQAEFLYDCVKQTIEQTIPEEVVYLEKYDRMKIYLDHQFEMPDKMVALLVRFLEQGNGTLSQRARIKEFNELSDEEVAGIETRYKEIFGLS